MLQEVFCTIIIAAFPNGQQNRYASKSTNRYFSKYYEQMNQIDQVDFLEVFLYYNLNKTVLL